MSIASTLVQVGSPCDQPGVRLVERVPVDTLTKIFRGEQPVAYSTETDRRALRSLHHHIGRGSGEHTVEYAFDHTNHYTKLTTAAPSLARLDPATRALLCGDTTQCIIMDTFVPRIVDQLARHYGHSSESLARHLEAPHGAIDSMLFRTFPPTKARDPVIHAIHQFVYGKLVPEVKAAFPQMWAVSSRRTRNAEAHLLATVCTEKKTEERNILNGINSKMNKRRAEIETVYKFNDKTNFGRLTTKTGIQRICSETRGFLFGGILQDIDMHNCAPTIIHQLANHYGLKCDLLAEQVSNRNAMLDRLGMTKIEFFIGMFSSNIAKDAHPEYKVFHSYLYNVMIPTFKKHHEDIWTMAATKDRNRNGTFLSYLYQCIECKLLLAAKDFCVKQGIEPAVLMYDGLMVKRSSMVTNEFFEQLGAYTFEKTGFKMIWAEKLVEAPCSIPPPDDVDEDDDKPPTEIISEFIINEFKEHGYTKDVDHIYAPSQANRFYYKPLMTVEEYISYILDDKFETFYNRDAAKFRRHVAQRLAHGSKNIRQYKPNRSVIAFKNGILFTGTKENRQWGLFSMEQIESDPEWFSNHCSGNTVAWAYIDNEFDFSIPKEQWMNLDFGPYQDVLDLQFGENRKAMLQYVMLYFGRTMYPVGYYDNWAMTPYTWGESGTGKSLCIKLIQKIHGEHNFQATARDDTVTKYTIAYTKDKVGWEMTDVDADFLQKFGFNTFKNLVEGKGLSSSLKHGAEKTESFHAHLLPTSNELLVLEELYNEVTKRLVFIPFTNKPEKENDQLIVEVASKYLLNITVAGLAVYHDALNQLESRRGVNVRDDVLDQFFKDASAQAKTLNDPIGKALLHEDCSYVVTKDPKHMVPFSDLMRGLDLQPKTKWDTKTMAMLGLKKENIKVCKHCQGLHVKGCCDQYERADRTQRPMVVGIAHKNDLVSIVKAFPAEMKKDFDVNMRVYAHTERLVQFEHYRYLLSLPEIKSYDWVMFTDDDDLWHPQRVEIMQACTELPSECMYLTHSLQFKEFDVAERKLMGRFDANIIHYEKLPEFLFESLEGYDIAKSGINYVNAVYRTSIVERFINSVPDVLLKHRYCDVLMTYSIVHSTIPGRHLDVRDDPYPLYYWRLDSSYDHVCSAGPSLWEEKLQFNGDLVLMRLFLCSKAHFETSMRNTSRAYSGKHIKHIRNQWGKNATWLAIQDFQRKWATESTHLAEL
ncbi:hypothetical protein GGF31_003235 [Allomyces arbusculus]|nr:hypothetical protein GGF31_003235 [Allomyces arbusculus]